MSNPSLNNKTIALIDSAFTVEELLALSKQENVLIITFDYASHKKLSNHKILHDISDSYLSENELITIQNTSYRLSKWYDQPEISEILRYENINLGKLFFIEFHYLLLPFLKKFMEITNIFNKYGNAQFITSSNLYEIMRYFTTSIKKIQSENLNPEPVDDFIEVPIKIGKNAFPIRIKTHLFLKLKAIPEKIIRLLIQPNLHPEFDNTVMMVDFTTLRYSSLFSALPNFSLNLVKFDRTIPAIWDLETFSIIKKSHCMVESYHTLMDKHIKKLISEHISLFDSKVDSLLRKDNFFESFFSINGYSFWNAIKPIFSKLCKKRIADGIREIELTKKLFGKYKFTSIMVWSEGRVNDIIVIELAKKLHIPVILVQHGLYIDTPESYEYLRFPGLFPIESDKFFIWGKIQENYCKQSGIPSEKIITLGNPYFDKIFRRKIEDSAVQDEFVLLAPSLPVKNNARDLTVKVMEDYETTIQKICQDVLKANKKLVIKTHSAEYLGEDEIAKDVDPKISVIKAGDIVPLIEKCDVLVTTDMTTAILEAQIMGKPVISVAIRGDYGEPAAYRSNGCIRTTIGEFGKELSRLSEDPDFKQKTILNGKKFLENYLSNHGTAAEAMLSFLEKFH